MGGVEEVVYFLSLMQHMKKGTICFPVCGTSNAHAQSPICAIDMCFYLKLPRGPSKGSGKTACMQACLSLSW